MSRPILYVAITNHGFGHAARMAAVAAVIQQLCPDILLILVTTAPRWLLESYLQGDFIHRPRSFDVGVVQSDSLTMDKPATLEKLLSLRSQQRSLIAAEVNYIRQNRVGLVLADLPPLSVEIAQASGIPCWMSSNFGWDLIYRAWGGEFVEIADWISDCFSRCDRLFRLPFHEPMNAFKSITDVGLTGGSPQYDLDELRATWGITAPKEKTVLLTFGGLGLQEVPYHNLQYFPDWQFITFGSAAPDEIQSSWQNLITISDRRYRPVDLMPLCGRVVSKPGYSTFAEAVGQKVPIVTMTREDFAEAAFLLEGITNYSQHQILSPSEFFQSKWEFLDQPLQMPQQPQALVADGNHTIANAVVSYFQP